MRIRTKHIFYQTTLWVVTLLLVGMPPAFVLAQDLSDSIVCCVNKAAITQRMLDQRVKRYNQIYADPDGPTRGKVPPTEAIQQRVIQDLIDEELMLEKYKDTIRASVAERYAQRNADEQIKAMQEGLGNEKFQASLIEENMCLDEFREYLKSQATRQIMVQQARQAMVDEYLLQPISQVQVEKYVNEHPEISDQGAAPEVQFIFFKNPKDAPPEKKTKIEEKARQVMNRARVGEPFEKLVLEFSEHEQSRQRDGVLELMSRTVPFPEFGVLFDLDPGQVYSDLIQITDGWLVVAKVRNKQSLYNLVRRKMAEEKAAKDIEEMRKEAMIQYNKTVFPTQGDNASKEPEEKTPSSGGDSLGLEIP